MCLVRTILVVDGSNYDRGKAISLAFSRQDKLVIFHNGREFLQPPEFVFPFEVDIPRPLLVILHNNNAEDLYNLQLTADIIVRYTGDHPYPYPNNEYWVKQRGISSQNSALSHAESEEILDWAEAMLEGITDIPLPSVMLSTLNMEVTSALSILCQGYLATNSKSTDPVAQKALDAMGWNTFKDSSNYAEIIHTDLSEKEVETKQRSWWLESFDIDCNEPDAEIHRQIDKIHEQVKKEWSVPKHGEVCSCINELINALKNLTSIEDPTIVANAYLAISHRLAHE